MALDPKIFIDIINNCNKVDVWESTGMYNSTTNPTGWGFPNITPNDVLTAKVTIFDYTGNTLLQTIVLKENPIDLLQQPINGNVALAVSTTGDSNINSNTLVNVTNISGIQPGMLITGVGIPPNTFVEYTYAGNLVIISNNATSTNVGRPIKVYSYIPAIDASQYKAIASGSWSQATDGVYKIVYTIVDNSNNTYTNGGQYELMICNLESCMDKLIAKLVDICDEEKLKRYKETLDQLEILKYGIKTAFASGDFATATSLISDANTLCTTFSDCGCGCNDCN